MTVNRSQGPRDGWTLVKSAQNGATADDLARIGTVQQLEAAQRIVGSIGPSLTGLREVRARLAAAVEQHRRGLI